MKRTLAVITGIVALLVVLAGSWAVVQRVRARPPEGVIGASGRIEGEEILVNSKVGGRVQRLLVGEGDPVSQGQLVTVLSSEELDAKLRQADAQVGAARAQVAQASSQVEALAQQLAQANTAVALPTWMKRNGARAWRS